MNINDLSVNDLELDINKTDKELPKLFFDEEDKKDSINIETFNIIETNEHDNIEYVKNNDDSIFNKILFKPITKINYKYNLIDILKKLIFENNGYICGNFIIHEIYNYYITTIIYNNLKHLTKLEILYKFNDINYLPEYSNRFKKYLNNIDIIIYKDNYKQFYDDFIKNLNDTYTILADNIIPLKSSYNDYKYEYQKILITHEYFQSVITLNIIIQLNKDKLQIPLGIYYFREQYLLSNGKKYKLSSCIPDLENNLLFITLNNIQNKYYSIMPYMYNNYNLKYILNKYLEINDIIIIFIVNIDKNVLGDYYMSNKYNDLVCCKCKISIIDKSECYIIKCCSSAFHSSCLLECYQNYELSFNKSITKYHCPICSVTKLDTYYTNSSILLTSLNFI